MRLSKHGVLGETAERILQEIENLLNIEFYVRCPSEYARNIKINAFKHLNRNGKQELIFYFKGEGKYVVRPDRVLSDEEIEIIKKYLTELGFFERVQLAGAEREIIETKEEIMEVEGEFQKRIIGKRRYRKFGIKPADRKAAIELAIEEIIAEEGLEVRDLVTKIKRKFEEFFGIEDYPYLMIWQGIRELDQFEISKINNRWFRIKRKDEDEILEQTASSAGNPLRDFIEKIKEMSFSTILYAIENLSEEERKLLLLFLRLIET